MWKKRIIQTCGVILIASGIGLAAFGLFGKAGLLDIFTTQPVKVYDWTEEDLEEDSKDPNEVGMPEVEDTGDATVSDTETEEVVPENTAEGDTANEETE